MNIKEEKGKYFINAQKGQAVKNSFSLFRQESPLQCIIIMLVIEMTVTVYLDELIFLNSMVSFIILAGLKRFFYSTVGYFRLFLVSLLSGIFGAVFFFLPVGMTVSFVLRIAFSTLIVLLSFGFHDRHTFLYRCLIFSGSSLICAGIVFVVEELTGSDAFGVVHLTPYVHLSPFVLFGVSVAFYFAIWILVQLRPHRSTRELFVVDLIRHSHSVSVTALCDTGNCVRDLYTGKTVVLCFPDAVSDLFTKAELRSVQPGCRYLPVSTVSGNELLRTYVADQMVIHDGSQNYIITAPLIALCDTLHDGDFNAIISSEIISDCREGVYQDVSAITSDSPKNNCLDQNQIRSKLCSLYQRT